jgi:hypothetical protein
MMSISTLGQERKLISNRLVGAPDSENRPTMVPMMAYNHTNFLDGLLGALSGGGGGACEGHHVVSANLDCSAATDRYRPHKLGSNAKHAFEQSR